MNFLETCDDSEVLVTTHRPRPVYHLEKDGDGVAIVCQFGAILYDDVSDLTPHQQDRLVELHNRDENMTWEKAWAIIEDEGLYPAMWSVS